MNQRVIVTRPAAAEGGLQLPTFADLSAQGPARLWSKPKWAEGVQVTSDEGGQGDGDPALPEAAAPGGRAVVPRGRKPLCISLMQVRGRMDASSHEMIGLHDNGTAKIYTIINIHNCISEASYPPTHHSSSSSPASDDGKVLSGL